MTPSQKSLLATGVIAASIMALLLTQHMSLEASEHQWPPKREHEVALVEENIFEVTELPRKTNHKAEQAAPAKNPVKENNASTPAPTTGHDVADRGAASKPPTTVTSTRQSPVKQQTAEQHRDNGPSRDQQLQEEARRRATSTTENAFAHTRGNNNTSNDGRVQGNSGRPNGTSGSFNGTGTGRVNGGWNLPAYRRIASTVTGIVKVKAYINRSGNVTKVEFLTGEPPAATNASVRDAVRREVESRRFTRNDNDAPDQSVAYITYKFTD